MTSSGKAKRKVEIGLFDFKIRADEIVACLKKHNIFAKYLATSGEGRLSLTPVFITEGVIFDDLDEFAAYARIGISPSDIMEGANIAEEIEEHVT